MFRVATLAKMIKPMATTQLTTIELVMKLPQRSILTADCDRPCSASAANTVPAGNTITKHNHRWSAVLMNQYFSSTNFRPWSDAWSSYAPFIERFGSFTFSRGAFL
jgi:hypothetical protein